MCRFSLGRATDQSERAGCGVMPGAGTFLHRVDQSERAIFFLNFDVYALELFCAGTFPQVWTNQNGRFHMGAVRAGTFSTGLDRAEREPIKM